MQIQKRFNGLINRKKINEFIERKITRTKLMNANKYTDNKNIFSIFYTRSSIFDKMNIKRLKGKHYFNYKN